MSAYLTLPVRFLTFWFVTAPLTMLRYFGTYNKAFIYLLSLPLFLRTFFKPLKNEYRSGLVGFSIAMGMAVKSFLIFFDLSVLLIVLMIEAGILIGFLFVPIGTIYLLFL